MTGFYLITGFLGAGKTTFLKEFVRLFPAERLAVLINEFGKEDVDGVQLRTLGAQLQEVHNGSIFCACRAEQFADALTSLLEKEPETILVETSGLSDPTQIRAILAAHARADAMEYRGCICLADASRLEKAYQAALACRKQLAVADVVVLNKTDQAGEALEGARRLLREHRPEAPVLETVRGRIPPAWAQRLRAPALLAADGGIHTRDLSLQSRVLRLKGTVPRARVEALLQTLLPGAWRIKGFVRLPEGVFLAETVGEELVFTRWEAAVDEDAIGRLVVLSGGGLPLRASLAAAQETCADILLAVE